MARPLRLELKGALYHVTARGTRREDIYLDDSYRKRFLTLVAEVCEQFTGCWQGFPTRVHPSRGRALALGIQFLQRNVMRFSACLLLICFVFAIARTASAEPTESDTPSVNRTYIGESVTGEYIDFFNRHRMWISESEVHKVIFQPIQKSNDPTQQLMMHQLMDTVLTLQPRPDEENVRNLLNNLHETGISTRCTTVPARFIAADAASRSATIRFPNANEDQVVDMLLLLSRHWSATYMSFRSKELARHGVLPFVDAKESERGRKAPLDELPFMAPSLIYRISKQSKPSIDWCLK